MNTNDEQTKFISNVAKELGINSTNFEERKQELIDKCNEIKTTMTFKEYNEQIANKEDALNSLYEEEKEETKENEDEKKEEEIKENEDDEKEEEKDNDDTIPAVNITKFGKWKEKLKNNKAKIMKTAGAVLLVAMLSVGGATLLNKCNGNSLLTGNNDGKISSYNLGNSLSDRINQGEKPEKKTTLDPNAAVNTVEMTADEGTVTKSYEEDAGEVVTINNGGNQETVTVTPPGETVFDPEPVKEPEQTQNPEIPNPDSTREETEEQGEWKKEKVIGEKDAGEINYDTVLDGENYSTDELGFNSDMSEVKVIPNINSEPTAKTR